MGPFPAIAAAAAGTPATATRGQWGQGLSKPVSCCAGVAAIVRLDARHGCCHLNRRLACPAAAPCVLSDRGGWLVCWLVGLGVVGLLQQTGLLPWVARQCYLRARMLHCSCVAACDGLLLYHWNMGGMLSANVSQASIDSWFTAVYGAHNIMTLWTHAIVEPTCSSIARMWCCVANRRQVRAVPKCQPVRWRGFMKGTRVGSRRDKCWSKRDFRQIVI